MEEKMLKKNLFFVIFGMLALCAMLAMACNGGGGGEEQKPPDPSDEPTPQELADAAIGSMSGLKVSAGTANAYGSLSFTLTGGTNEVGATFPVSNLKIGGSTVTGLDAIVLGSPITFPPSAFIEEAIPASGDVVTFDVKATKSSATSAGSKTITVPAASIATLAPAILALRQVKTELAATGGGSATITGETSAGSVGTITVDTGSISLAYGGSASIILTGGTSTVGNHSFGDDYDSLVTSADFAIGTLVSNVLSITDKGYAGTGVVGTLSGTITASGGTEWTYGTGSHDANGSFSVVKSGSVSATVNGIVLTAEGLKYTAPVFTITVHTTRSDGLLITNPPPVQ
jgi:hypothetical protein